MEPKNSEFEEVDVSVPVGLPFEGFDLVVDPFKRTSGDAVVVVRKDSLAVSLQCTGEGCDQWDVGCSGTLDPTIEEAAGDLFVRLLPQLP